MRFGLTTVINLCFQQQVAVTDQQKDEPPVQVQTGEDAGQLNSGQNQRRAQTKGKQLSD